MKNKYSTILLILSFHCCLAYSALAESVSDDSTSFDSLKYETNIFRLIHQHNEILEWLPVANYDSDLGFGFGVKSFYLNPLGYDESFDLILFASTKGERWAKFVFSIPDFELRHGKLYDYAIDVTVDYNVIINSKYFGRYPDINNDYLTYDKKLFFIDFNLSKPILDELLISGGIRFSYLHSDYKSQNINPENNIPLLSLLFKVNYDKRDSYINPENGYLLSAYSEFSPQLLSETDILKGGIEASAFIKLLGIVLAQRVRVEAVKGSNIPFEFLAALGGNKTLRGRPQDRYVGPSSMLSNSEIRFPLLWNFSAVAGLDAGQVFDHYEGIALNELKINPVAGLRYNFKTYIVRFDVGFSKEYTGIFFNFGHIF